MKFQPVSSRVDIQKLEQEQLQFWRDKQIFKRTVQEREGGKSFVFYEGPPTANGRPGIHHVMARAFKDIFPRYKIMKGYYVQRKGGWDTHGLPVEIEVEKELGLEIHMDNNVILLAEDNPDDVELTLRAFKQNKLRNEIVVARDGVEALDYLFGTGTYADRDVSIMPHLILLDLNMPKVDGLEVLQAMRADPRTALIPVVVLTSSEGQEDIVRSYRFGVNSFVRKPVDFTDFLKAVQQLELYWLVLNKSPSS